MARHHDVSSRLAEGRESVAHTQAYVSACHRLGYRQHGLTDYDGQLAERYDSEAGLDLGLLEADCAALAALADAAEEALRIERGQLAELAAAWRGPGAAAAAEFLRRHCEAAERLTVGLRSAATGCGALRDDLWHWVDAKVAAVVGVDDRVSAQRSAWLAAARAVSSGADDPDAVTVIEQQVMPHVDNDVRGPWLAAMRSTDDGIASAYDAAIAAIGPVVGLVFAIPGDLGPGDQSDVTGFVMPLPVAPMTDPVDVPPAPQPAVAPGSPPKAVGDPAPTGLLDGESSAGIPGELGLPGGLGLPSAGMPAGGGLGGLAGLGGLVPRLIEAFGDPGAGQQFDESFDDHPPDNADPPESEDPTDSLPEAEPVEQAAEYEPDMEASAGEVPASDAAPESAAVVGDSEPALDKTGGGEAEPTAGSADVLAPKTPCEIAAEELPQVGE